MLVGDVTEQGTVLFEARARTRVLVTEAVLPMVIGLGLGIPYVVLIRNRDGSAAENLLISSLAVLVCAGVLAFLWARQRAVFQVTATHVVKRRTLRRPIMVRRDEIAEAVVTKEYAVVRDHRPRALFLAADTSTLLTTEPLSDLADVEALAHAAPVATYLEVLRPEQTVQRWPLMLPWSHRHQRAAAVVTGGVVVVATLVAFVIGITLF
ncbi:hypothetical protein [Ornithinicoccus hortensis]|uniref:Uncharacterized protein n=1 Tax=Ornithinicoccus hortensis TaxID=82346 RepID=A0A542YMX5_9MICO|nr:hypothetical protein [Ornithinicoccus hortensis]TQL49445.1 hypothetical protein FB467_0515 [Ornithinicoccus hortensis]